MTTFETIIILALTVALTAIVITLAIHNSIVIRELKEINHHQIGIHSKLLSILDTCDEQQAAWVRDVTTIIKELSATEQAVKDLLDFETRHGERYDEMFARAEEINKLQLKELQKRVHTYDTETKSALDSINEVKQDNQNTD